MLSQILSFPRRRETTFGGANLIIIRTLLLVIPACAGMTSLATALRQFELKTNAVKCTGFLCVCVYIRTFSYICTPF